LKDEEWAVRSHAAKSLGHTGPEAKDVVSSLNMALNDDNEFIREAARETPTSR
jgi:HEAT repeat protein